MPRKNRRPQKQICYPPDQSARNGAAKCCQVFLPDAMLALTETMGFFLCNHNAHQKSFKVENMYTPLLRMLSESACCQTGQEREGVSDALQ